MLTNQPAFFKSYILHSLYPIQNIYKIESTQNYRATANPPIIPPCRNLAPPQHDTFEMFPYNYYIHTDMYYIHAEMASIVRSIYFILT